MAKKRKDVTFGREEISFNEEMGRDALQWIKWSKGGRSAPNGRRGTPTGN